jgi:hypothetical protein
MEEADEGEVMIINMVKTGKEEEEDSGRGRSRGGTFR